LGDILLLDLMTFEWTAVSQQGFIPPPRWGAALAYNHVDQRVYIFGGSNYTMGACGNNIYCLETKSINISGKVQEYRGLYDEISVFRKNANKAAKKNANK
jgi:hypothetical protein